MFLSQIDQLSDRIMADEPSNMSIVNRMLDSCTGYVSHIDYMERSMQMQRVRMDTKDFQEHVMELDSSRKRYHDGCMTNMNITNRCAGIYGMEPIFPDMDKLSRTEIADKYIIPLVAECANRGITDKLKETTAEKTASLQSPSATLDVQYA